MKRILAFFLLSITLLSGISYGEQGKKDVYVIPIKGEINRGTYDFLNTTVNNIVTKSPEAIIFEIDTYGGIISEAEKIKNLILDLKVPTIAFVNNKAESAGVLITISAEKVVMAESSTIGSASTIPEDEKVLSMWRSFLRDVAQQRGRNVKVIEAMADKDIAIEGISEEGKLLNLTSKEALELKVADYISNNYEDILSHFNIAYDSIVQVEENLQVKFSKFISSYQISILLLTFGFIGMILEIFIPGFGIGGIISIISFGLFFAGNIMAGNSQWTSLIVFIIGLILLVIEAISPGFGLPGISGIILIIAGIILAIGSVKQALESLSISIILTTIITILLIRRGYSFKSFDKIVLNTNLNKEGGYISSGDKKEYLGKEGIAISELRPSGIVEINGERLDAISEGVFIPKNANIKVVKVEGSKIIVRRL